MESSYSPYRYPQQMRSLQLALDLRGRLSIRKLIFQTHSSGAMLVQTRYIQMLFIVNAANMITVHLRKLSQPAPWSPGLPIITQNKRGFLHQCHIDPFSSTKPMIQCPFFGNLQPTTGSTGELVFIVGQGALEKRWYQSSKSFGGSVFHQERACDVVSSGPATYMLGFLPCPLKSWIVVSTLILQESLELLRMIELSLEP